MAEPEPIKDEEPDPAPDDAKTRPGARPDWLVGAEEAMESELERFGGPESAPPELRSATPPPDRPRPTPPAVNPYAGFAQSEAGRSFGTKWMETGYAGGPAPDYPASPAHAANHPSAQEATPDSPDDHARVGDAPDHDADVAPADEDPAPDHVAGATPTAPAAAKPRRAAPAPPPPPPQPWWNQAATLAATPYGLIAAGIVVVLLIVVFMVLGAKNPSVAISALHHDAERFDGRTVQVRGTVGEVYPVGGGYSFYLLQGRDTIVVFTRSRTPVRDERIAVTGVVSTGVLNGQLRQALLENTQP